MRKLSTAVIGLGKQNLENHLPAVLESETLSLEAVCDVDHVALDKASAQYGVDGFTSVAELLRKKRLDLAIVGVPHAEYYPIVSALAEAGVNIFKEKPFAISLDEANRIDGLIDRTKVKLMINLQRRFNPVFQAFEQVRRRIGRVYAIEGKYTKNIASLDSGWRSSRDMSGGGALLDMGYHYIDLLVWYFGVPRHVSATMTNLGRKDQRYDVEDSVNLSFSYDAAGPDDPALAKTIGSLIVSRAGHESVESFSVLGTNGRILIQRGRISRFDAAGKEIESLSRDGQWFSAAIDQLDYFSGVIQGIIPERKDLSYKEHFKHMAIIDAAYRSNSGPTPDVIVTGT
jgi:predicted dehydrogenase